jgi:hypothetical protein
MVNAPLTAGRFRKRSFGPLPWLWPETTAPHSAANAARQALPQPVAIGTAPRKRRSSVGPAHLSIPEESSHPWSPVAPFVTGDPYPAGGPHVTGGPPCNRCLLCNGWPPYVTGDPYPAGGPHLTGGENWPLDRPLVRAARPDQDAGRPAPATRSPRTRIVFTHQPAVPDQSSSAGPRVRRLGRAQRRRIQRPRNAPTRAATSALNMRRSVPSVTKSKPFATMLRA